jgi:hypothetical protein
LDEHTFSTLILAPRRQHGSPFSIKQAPDLSQGKYNQYANNSQLIAEENQPLKRYKTSNTHNEHDIPQASPIRDELDSQNPISIGEEESKRETDVNAQ